jgi:hypothetical protein
MPEVLARYGLTLPPRAAVLPVGKSSRPPAPAMAGSLVASAYAER